MSLHRIPNGLVITIAVLYYVWVYMKGVPANTVMAHTAIAIAVLFLLLMLQGLGNGGTIKLTAAIFLWLGLGSGLIFMALSFGLCGLSGYMTKTAGLNDGTMPFMPFAAIALAAMTAVAGFPPGM